MMCGMKNLDFEFDVEVISRGVFAGFRGGGGGKDGLSSTARAAHGGGGEGGCVVV